MLLFSAVCVCLCVCVARSQCKLHIYFICRFWLKKKSANTALSPPSVNRRGLREEPRVMAPSPTPRCGTFLVSFHPMTLGCPYTHLTCGVQANEVLIVGIWPVHLNRNLMDIVMRQKVLEKDRFMEFWAKKAFTLIRDSQWRELNHLHKDIWEWLWNLQSIKPQVFSRGLSPQLKSSSCCGSSCSHTPWHLFL